MNNLEHLKIILVSKSPRRKELLSGLGVKFEVRTKDTDESFPSKLPVEKVAGFISEKKARAFSGEIHNEEVIIASDTIVVMDGVILGKPSDHAEAEEMLKKTFGKITSGFYSYYHNGQSTDKNPYRCSPGFFQRVD